MLSFCDTQSEHAWGRTESTLQHLTSLLPSPLLLGGVSPCNENLNSRIHCSHISLSNPEIAVVTVSLWTMQNDLAVLTASPSRGLPCAQTQVRTWMNEWMKRRLEGLVEGSRIPSCNQRGWVTQIYTTQHNYAKVSPKLKCHRPDMSSVLRSVPPKGHSRNVASSLHCLPRACLSSNI